MARLFQVTGSWDLLWFFSSSSSSSSFYCNTCMSISRDAETFWRICDETCTKWRKRKERNPVLRRRFLSDQSPCGALEELDSSILGLAPIYFRRYRYTIVDLTPLNLPTACLCGKCKKWTASCRYHLIILQSTISSKWKISLLAASNRA